MYNMVTIFNNTVLYLEVKKAKFVVITLHHILNVGLQQSTKPGVICEGDRDVSKLIVVIISPHMHVSIIRLYT